MSRADTRVPLVTVAFGGAVLGLLFGAVFFGEGSGDGATAWLGSLAVLVAAASLVATAFGALTLPRLDRAGGFALAAVVALTAWVGLSIVWSIAGDRSWSALGKGLVYTAFLVLGLVLSSALGARAARWTAAGLALLLAATLGWALLGRAVPGLFPDGGRIARLREPVDYWNALALLAGAAAPIGLWLTVAFTRRAARVSGGLLVYAAVVVVMLTQSRAGLLALLAGVALWLALSRTRLHGALLGLCAAAPGLVVASWTFTRPALVDDGALRADRVDDGIVFAAIAIAGAAVAAALVMWVPVERMVARNPRAVTVSLAGAAVGVLVVGVLALVVAVGNPVSWARDQVSGGECTNDPSRLAELCANNRVSWWGEALEVFGDHPAGGTGALTFEIARKRVRDDGTPVKEPHSVPLQMMADLGVLGLALGLTFAGAAALGVRAAIRRLDGPEREAAVALACFPAVYGVHALVDYDLDFLAVTAPALLTCGVLFGAARPTLRVGSPLLAASAAVATAIAVIVVLAAPALADRYVDDAYRDVDAGRLTDATSAADRARSLDPLALEPVYAAATVADRAGNEALARGLYRRATEMQPENPDPWIMLGIYEFAGRNDMCQAYAALNHAYTLDPNSRVWEPRGPLDIAKDAVNAGACEKQ